MTALDPSGEVWKHLPRHYWGAPKRIVLPLLEPHVASMPPDCWALIPDATALATFADKQAFARYAARQGLRAFVPKTLDPAAPVFPLVLKRLNLNAGSGIAVVNSQAELDEHLTRAPWAGQKVMLQNLVPSRTDYVTHLVATGGHIVWHQTYVYDLDGPRVIRGGKISQQPPPRRVATSAADLAVFERFLLPLSYDGPANIDYRRRRDGSLAIFEINPRLGGSLMRPENVRDLAGALTAISRHAKWREPAHVEAGVGVTA
jgi:carbamoylphosphate synthase large subunit